MSAGDQITSNYQYEYNGLLLGSMTRYVVKKVSGLLMPPSVRSQDKERTDAHGSFPGRRLYEPRSISFDIAIDATSQAQVEADLLALGTAFQISELPIPFVWQRPNGLGKRFCWGFVEDSDFDSDYDVAHGLAAGSVQLLCNDPRIYSLAQTTTSFNLGAGATTGNATITNDGNFNSFPIIEIDGPFNDPIIANAGDNNRQIRLLCTIPAGTILRLNTKIRTIETKTGGGAWINHYEYRADDNQWWRLVPGANPIAYTRAGINNGALSQIRVFWNKSWMN